MAPATPSAAAPRTKGELCEQHRGKAGGESNGYAPSDPTMRQ